MPGRPMSEEEKRRKHIKTVEKWTAKAVAAYQEEQEKPDGKKKMGLHTICTKFKEECFKQDKVTISLTKSTLKRRLNGVPSQAKSNAAKSWLVDKEADAIIDYANERANEGWPLSRRRIEDHANEVIQARQGADFEGVGHNWTDRFILKHKDRLRGSWSRPLDKARAQAGNPIAKADYFAKLKTVIEGEEGKNPIPAELMYGVDETGIQEGVGCKERVYREPTKKFQHQQRSGERENITVIVTICADGTSLPPAVIFKGENFQSSWKQDNPLHAS